MTCWTIRLWLTGSGGTGRFWAAARRGTSEASLRLDAVLGAGLLAVAHPRGVERAPDHLVAEAREILDAATPDQDHRVLLQVVALAGDVGADLEAVGQPDPGHLAQSRVGLLGRGRVDPRADASA